MISGSEGQKADAIWYQGVKIPFDPQHHIYRRIMEVKTCY